MSLLKAAPVFSDNMVLQRDKPAPVWGAGEEGRSVRVVWDDGKRRVERCGVVKGGLWRVTLPPLEVCDSGALTVSDADDTVRLANVAVGDVWLAGGQSNMELELQNCYDGARELAACNNAHIRFYQPVKAAVVNAAFLCQEARTSWQECKPDTAAALSAVAWFFARRIHAETGVPQGIINCNWGGTSISCWMSEGQLARSAAGQRCLDDYEALIGGKSEAEYDEAMRAYAADWDAWNTRVLKRRERDPDVSWEVLNAECGECPWPQPAGKTSPFRPTNLYTAMLSRLAPYALKGFLYYQGEEDADTRASSYAELTYYLVDQWRGDFCDAPFLFVQLPMWASKKEYDDGAMTDAWPVLREQQHKASRDIAGVGMAVIIDCGEFDNIHPLDKQTVGQRLALKALEKVYHKDVEADGPVFSWAEAEAGVMRVHFDHAESGLELRGPPSAGATAAFEVAGEDGVYHAAKAAVDGGTLTVSSEKAAKPERVRYAWIKYGPTPLFAKNGLPAMPFRSHKD
jgi:sialate O-acetylesterase